MVSILKHKTYHAQIMENKGKNSVKGLKNLKALSIG